ncbi:serine hydrolase [Bradyrhizobium prioriisuperbiae]|uniref:serine hydrolase domain-containing protein n=1 Tax=Bradyrhizobium prioriisuperbiae TaxID=2854389 RepID=UPI0028F08D9B|nr:serine hydrolase [Bradyrhizobium prioritasuperba]
MTLAFIICGFALAAVLFGIRYRLDRVVGVPVHFASHQLCSAVFVGGLDPTDYYREAIQPKFGSIGKLIHYEIDRERSEVRVSLAGLVSSRAVDEGSYGCRVVHSGNGVHGTRNEKRASWSQSSLPSIAEPGPVVPGNTALSQALDHAFAEPATAPHRWTKAVVVLHRGQVIAERYAPGMTAVTPLHGWSMTKSVTNALLGILVRKGKLDVNGPAPIAEWFAPGDSRRRISIDQMLRMVSGINCGQSLHFGWWTIFDTDTHMEFDMPDQFAFAASRGLRAEPGHEWRYTNCNFVLLSRIVRDAIGGDAESTRQFIERELFGPLGIEHATQEYDSAGTPLGTIHLWASARDWARFGLLYLRDGVSPGGQRILPEGWVDYSARLTPQSDAYGYGAGFWTQRGNSSAARERVAAGFPADSFMALGSQGQYTIVIPSEDLVIVKLGNSYTPHDDIVAVQRLVKDTIAALHAD